MGASASFPLSVSCSHSKRDSGHKHGMSPRAHSCLSSLRDFAAHHLCVTFSLGQKALPVPCHLSQMFSYNPAPGGQEALPCEDNIGKPRHRDLIRVQALLQVQSLVLRTKKRQEGSSPSSHPSLMKQGRTPSVRDDSTVPRSKEFPSI